MFKIQIANIKYPISRIEFLYNKQDILTTNDH